MKKIKIAISIQKVLEYEDNIQSFEVWGHVETTALEADSINTTFKRILRLGDTFIKKGLNGNEN